MSEAVIHARSASFFKDLISIAGRAIRGTLREPETFIPAIIIPLFFYVVNVGALGKISGAAGVENFNAFQIPVAIIFAVTGVSRASSLVTDIQNGYFDRLMLTPISRFALLFGLMAADFLVVLALSIPVLIMGFFTSVSFATGLVGVLTFLLLSGLWGLAFTGFPMPSRSKQVIQQR